MKPSGVWCMECRVRGKTHCGPCVERSEFKALVAPETFSLAAIAVRNEWS